MARALEEDGLRTVIRSLRRASLFRCAPFLSGTPRLPSPVRLRICQSAHRFRRRVRLPPRAIRRS